ncbi:PilZ domain-containing protein [Novosphingobium sp. KCTC 2891]|uniref:PilZ domain-containing protein n=1 Tax=Novosphingobium sp. KCTC 2891 TaxID=2989730 RepID=UPI002222BD2E|nr:PilZ domain-containing protein [Novosphingobium sp. KCTC 2891]MCW1383536.1 PilZ domain-containing protein [Novosphingobium sp. KCTC 2891]
MSFIEPLPENGASQRERRTARIIRATLFTPGASERDVVIRNISSRGIGATCRSVAPVRGEQATLVLPGALTASGVVRWTNGQAFGIELDADLDIAALEQTLQRKVAEVPVHGSWKIEDRHRVHTPRVDPTRLRRI